MTNLAHLISLPYSGAAKLHDNLLKHRVATSNSKTITTSPEQVAKLKLLKIAGQPSPLDWTSLQDPTQVGLIISEPASRLLRAWKTQKSAGNTSLDFRQFYQQSNQLNYVSKVLNDGPVEQLGFVGIEELPLESLFLAQHWLGWTSSRIAYANLFNNSNETPIGESEREEINRLHHLDYQLYTKSKQRVLENWQRFLTSNELVVPSGREIIVHLGPPKTGTSAIQYWLQQNSATLSAAQVFYPQHGVDQNNISSGNFQRLISHDDSAQLGYFDLAKAQELLDEFAASQQQRLLLSSEHFFYFMPWLFRYFRQARYVFYVRHPLATLESSYHQQIKRHKRTSEFGLPRAAKFQQLDIVAQVAKSFSVDIEFRYFDDALFAGGSIINDFCGALQIELDQCQDNQRINSKYTLAALELMRACNGFASEHTLQQLDRWLQSYSEGKGSGSLITQQQNEQIKPSMRAHAKLIQSRLPSLDGQRMNALIDNYRPQPPKTAQDVTNGVERVFKQLKRDDVMLAKQLVDDSMLVSNPASCIIPGCVRLSAADHARIWLKRIQRRLS